MMVQIHSHYNRFLLSKMEVQNDKIFEKMESNSTNK